MVKAEAGMNGVQLELGDSYVKRTEMPVNRKRALAKRGSGERERKRSGSKVGRRAVIVRHVAEFEADPTSVLESL
jgi:hypothetical protein